MINELTRKKCVKCGYILEIPNGDCNICFGDVLSELTDIVNKDKRYERLEEWITDFLKYEYERGLHNAVCDNKYDYEQSYEEDEWKEIEMENNSWIEEGKVIRRQLKIPGSCYPQV